MTTDTAQPLKSRLLAKKRRLLKTVTLKDDEGEAFSVDLRKPTQGEKLDVFESAREAGEINEQNEPTSSRAGLRVGARMVAAVAYDPATGRPLFGADDLDDISRAPWFFEALEECKAVFNPEDVEGKSAATP